ncbi:glutathione synthase [Candidatus Liberibacter americanus]|uniref:Glutathione synthetase n=1 Tax=Candidatus Liberibacter americanus str. Sao Paulo TaxID=1261131 RepID=U6B6P9_9HYPH|nr:glutathione synthase [Candidatus Liberibacter americanus]AHA27422.1 Glutathione synthase/Ribosomal protein S6 modification enzyme [Candidatus Liberibacter americanus str. Sao Paulo]EMS36695.1 glutathione synthetase [Candidatus Liberibacter americanus PW_SP]
MKKIVNIAIQMDHISTINVTTDSTFAITLEAQVRGYNLFHYTPDQLYMRDNKVFANAEPMSLRDNKQDYYYLAKKEIIDLSQMDVVLIRQDPPFNMNYISSTYLLDKINTKTLIINNPFWIRNSPEKIFVTEFIELTPPTLISRDITQIVKFYSEIKDVIIKPLYGNGGEGIFRINQGDRNLYSLIEMLLSRYPEPLIVQLYLPQVRNGDKRILLLNGKPVGAINRIPSESENRSNIHVGGKAELSELTNAENNICRRIGPILQERGLFFTGIDVIGDYITEINVTSPTCIREIHKLGGDNIASLFWDKVETLFETLIKK